MPYKDILTEDDYRKIVAASISNHEIYQSFFTSDSLNNICLGEGGRAVECLEKLPKAAWDKFVKMNEIKLERQIDGGER